MKLAKSSSIIIDPKDIPVNFDYDINRGILEKIPFECFGTTRDVWVLYPDNMQPSQKYPVLYLIHGQGSNAEWPHVGHIKQIIGNMVSNNIIPEMIVVMPDIFVSNNKDYDYQNFANILEKKLIPYIENSDKYHAMTGWENRAIAGLSKGGLAVLYYAYQYYKKSGETFRYIGALSPTACLFSDVWISDRIDFKLGCHGDSCIFIGSGGKDIRIKIASQDYSDVLKHNGTSNIYAVLNHGEHDWDAFKRLFYVFMSYDFFRKK